MAFFNRMLTKKEKNQAEKKTLIKHLLIDGVAKKGANQVCVIKIIIVVVQSAIAIFRTEFVYSTNLPFDFSFRFQSLVNEFDGILE